VVVTRHQPAIFTTGKVYCPRQIAVNPVVPGLTMILNIGMLALDVFNHFAGVIRGRTIYDHDLDIRRRLAEDVT